MGCSQSDTSNQTAEKREKRMAKQQQGDDSTMTSDSTSTPSSKQQQQDKALQQQDKALQRAKVEKERARAKLSTLLQETDEPKGRSPNSTNNKSSLEDFVFPLPEKPQKSTPEEAAQLTPSSCEANPLVSRRASIDSEEEQKPAVAIDVVSDDGTRSVMGEVELASQVGMNSSTDMRSSGSSSGQKYRVETQLRAHLRGAATRPQACAPRPTVEELAARRVPNTYRPGGNRFRRINLWIEGTKSFQHLVSQAQGSKAHPGAAKGKQQHNTLPTVSTRLPTASGSPNLKGQHQSAGQRSNLDEELIVVNLTDGDLGDEDEVASACETDGRFSGSASSSSPCNAGWLTGLKQVATATVTSPKVAEEETVEDFEDLDDLGYDDDGF